MTITLLRVTLVISERWAVGGVAVAGDAVDLPLLVDPRNRDGHGDAAYVPGSSLAGSLKRHLGALGTTWLGDDPVAWEQKTGKLDPTPSAVAFLGAQPSEARLGVRGTTAVNMERGAADSGALRTERYAEPTTLVLAMQHDGPGNSDLVDALARWTPWVGRSRSSGMGRAVVTLVERVEVDLSMADDLTWWLTSRAEWLLGGAHVPRGREVIATPGKESNPQAPIRLTWRVDEPVHVGGAATPTDAHGAKVAQTMRFGGKVGVPGSTWKGVFRHRAESILSSVTPEEPWVGALIGRLFGTPAKVDDPDSGRGILWFSDAVSSVDVDTIEQTHVAIDRFTGGSREGALYAVAAIPRGVELTLDISPESPLPPAVLGLLGHVVADVHDGYVGVGRHSTRGYGSLTLTHRDGLPAAPAHLDLAGLKAFALTQPDNASAEGGA